MNYENANVSQLSGDDDDEDDEYVVDNFNKYLQ